MSMQRANRTGWLRLLLMASRPGIADLDLSTADTSCFVPMYLRSVNDSSAVRIVAAPFRFLQRPGPCRLTSRVSSPIRRPLAMVCAPGGAPTVTYPERARWRRDPQPASSTRVKSTSARRGQHAPDAAVTTAVAPGAGVLWQLSARWSSQILGEGAAATDNNDWCGRTRRTETHGFVTSFLAEWGESADEARGRTRKRRR